MNSLMLTNGVHEVASNSLQPNKVKRATAQSMFSNVLKKAIENVNNAEHEADVKTAALASGEIEDLHDVLISAQKASITLESTVQVQRKVIDAYNEIMRMQV